MTHAARPAPPGSEGLDPRLVKALSHPLRYQVLVRLNAGVASPVEIAREMAIPVGRVSHHVRTLAGIGAIELVRTRQRRGAVEHFYRAVTPAWFTDEDWAGLPQSARQAIGRQTLEQLLAHVAGAGFVHPRAHLSFMQLELDEQAMEEMSELLNETLERAYAIEAANAERSTAATTSTELVLMHFQRVSPPPS